MYTPSTKFPRVRPTSRSLPQQSHPLTSSPSKSATTWGGDPPQPGVIQRSVTPGPWPYRPNNAPDDRMIQRPKTVSSRLRKTITEQLLNQIEPDTHETIMQLQMMELQRSQAIRDSVMPGQSLKY